jgi:hypothetical protein
MHAPVALRKTLMWVLVSLPADLAVCPGREQPTRARVLQEPTLCGGHRGDPRLAAETAPVGRLAGWPCTPALAAAADAAERSRACHLQRCVRCSERVCPACRILCAGAYEALQRLRPSCDLMVVTSRQHAIQEPTLRWLEAHYPGVRPAVGLYFMCN